MENFVALIDALAWPITLIAILLVFRSELRSVLKRISPFKHRDTELEFKSNLKIAEQEAEQTDSELNGTDSLRKQRTKLEYITSLSEASPRAAVMEAWIAVEDVARRAAEANNLDHRSLGVGYELFEQLEKHGFQSIDLKLYSKWRALRHQAAHLPDFAISESEAERYARLALNLADHIKKFAFLSEDSA